MEKFIIGTKVILDPYNFAPEWFNEHAKGKIFTIVSIRNDKDEDGDYYFYTIDCIDGDNIIDEDLILYHGLTLCA